MLAHVDMFIDMTGSFCNPTNGIIHWHAKILLTGYPYLLTELSHSFSLSIISGSEVKDGEKRGE
ncbi:hypothetical protein SLEP1_g22204 [Rubroshorea leprosula]|uniref:Uncharacterized protein n=1 Tax=Rubroshorea leprosula TaxID=152421 RepID=A0AAV5J8F8_9ROSI|nr:hypothetical protein SLEP1_g22204 [Rubroshorea leprosula]